MLLFFKNQSYKLETSVINTRGDFVTGLTITYQIYKSSDNSLVTSGTMIEVGISGIYQIDVQFDNIGQFRVEYITPQKYENYIEIIYVEDIFQKILGLSQENYRIFNPQYDRHNNLIAGIIKIYPTANDVDNDTNIIAEYEISANFNLRTNLMTSYKVKKKL